MKKVISLVCTMCCVLPLYAQEYRPLLDTGRRDVLHEVLSGELAKEYTIHISRFHRIQGSRGYRESANYVLQKLNEFGFDKAEAFIESYPSDGKVVYQTWQSPSGWDMEAAELRMIEPYEERIVGFPEIPMSLITYSNPGDVTAELVWVGSGTSDSDYEGKDVRGKFVLATGYGGSVHRLAVLKYGARAVVCYLDDDRAKEYPDMLAYTGMWPKTEELERVTFGFNLTNRQGEKLKHLLEAGERVVLRGWARGIGLEPYWMDVVVARIEGSVKPEESFILVAHLDHPKESANDNASGSGALLDMCRGLSELIEQGRIDRPERSLVFLWVPEFYGSMAYIDAHKEVCGKGLGGTFLGCLNYDMVGEHLELIHTNMNLTRSPYSIPSVLNDVVANMAGMIDRLNVRTPRGSLSRFNYRVRPYSGGSDHVVFNDRKIPSMMFGHGDYTHHTSEDTPDKVDPVELERAEIIGASALLFLTGLNETQAFDLLHLAASASAERFGAASRRACHLLEVEEMDDILKGWAEARNVIDHVLGWEHQTLESVLDYCDTDAVRALLGRLKKQLEDQHQIASDNLRWISGRKGLRQRIPPALDTRKDPRIPIRLTRGPIASGIPVEKLSESDAAWYQTEGRILNGNIRYEIVNFVDGKRSVSEIRNAVSAAYRPIPLSAVSRYLSDLVRSGVMRWK